MGWLQGIDKHTDDDKPVVSDTGLTQTWYRYGVCGRSDSSLPSRIYFYGNGQVKEEDFHRQGYLYKVIEYYETGSVKSIYNYKYGLSNDDGSLPAVQRFRADGIREECQYGQGGKLHCPDPKTPSYYKLWANNHFTSSFSYNGKLHRVDGPAHVLCGPDSIPVTSLYYLHDSHVSKETHHILTSLFNMNEMTVPEALRVIDDGFVARPQTFYVPRYFGANPLLLIHNVVEGSVHWRFHHRLTEEQAAIFDGTSEYAFSVESNGAVPVYFKPGQPSPFRNPTRIIARNQITDFTSNSPYRPNLINRVPESDIVSMVWKDSDGADYFSAAFSKEAYSYKCRDKPAVTIDLRPLTGAGLNQAPTPPPTAAETTSVEPTTTTSLLQVAASCAIGLAATALLSSKTKTAPVPHERTR